MSMEEKGGVPSEALYEAADYRRSRMAYRFECTFEYFVTILVGGSFLATLLKSIGLDDALIGVISSFITLAFLFQLFSVFVAQRIANTKRFVIFFHTMSQLLFMVLYFIPFMPFALPYRKALVIVCVLAAYFGNYFVTSILYKWCNSYVHPEKRASFSAGKEMLSLATGVVMTLAVGYAMDSFEAAGNLHGGFLFAAVAIFIFSVADLVCLLLIRGESVPVEERPAPVPFREVMHNTLGNRDFRHVIVLTVLWDMARYFTIGFLGTWRIGELGFALVTIELINIVGNVARIIISRPFGRYSDKRSYAKGVELAMILAAVAFAFNVFTVPATRYLMIGYAVFYALCMAGLNQNMHNIVYSYVDSRYFVQASAIKNSIGGLFGFTASLLGARILAAVQAAGNTAFGIPLYGQQLLSAITVVLLVTAIFYNRLVIAKQHVMKQ